MNVELLVLIIILIALVLCILTGIVNYRLRLRKARSILDKWAKSQNIEIISAKPRSIFCGLFSIRGSKSQQVFQITTRMSNGQTRQGYANCGTMIMGLMSEKVNVRWED